jgi:cell division protein FtsB
MSLAVWRDISLIWLIFLALLAILPIGAVFFFAVRGMHQLRQVLKQVLPQAQETASLVAVRTDAISRKVAEPFIAAQARAAQVNGMTKAILTRRKSR